MSRLTLRLPETLHRQLETLAKREQTSLNQYLVYALTRQAAEAYTVHEFSEGAVAQQRVAFDALLQHLGPASSEQIEKVLAQRERTALERGLSPKIIKRVRKRLASQRSISARPRGEAQAPA
ncbi:MAG: toxin-antitoxin system HicB family antitoxin [Deltaproteobacteria bacterium]|nr:toxin-antitoxin system HicB family antitoxin [Deltaproteobacteria bacterium]